METLVTFYELHGTDSHWNDLCEAFRSHLSRNNVPFFKNDPEAEKSFLNFCGARSIRSTRKQILEFDGTGQPRQPFYFLSVHGTGEYDQGFIEMRCDGAGEGMCWNDARQLEKVTITDKLLKIVMKYGIVLQNYPVFPKVYLVTRALKEQIQSTGFTGLSFLPCLRAKAKYSSAEKEFGSTTQRLEAQAEVFQLLFDTTVVNPPDVGRITASRSCQKCGTVELFWSDTTFSFAKGDLLQVDAQKFIYCSSENLGVFKMTGDTVIISARLLDFLLKQTVKGLKNYSSDPPVKHAAVEIRD